MSTTTFFEHHIQSLKEKNPSFNKLQDYGLFTLLCMKYFFYSDSNVPFDQDLVIECFTDGANDGGIDAIFNDSSSENNDIIVVQSKYYNNSVLTFENVIGELYKIKETLKNLKSNKTAGYSEKLVTAYRNATSQMEDNGVIRIVFFTSYQPKNKKERNKFEKSLCSYFSGYDLELCFKNDIEAQIELCDNGKLCVDYDKIKIDKRDNYLEYEESVIVNISAQSLQELYQRRRNGLLGLNLRYYVKQAIVDNGIDKTVQSEPDNFWYKNNGILIICDDYELDGNIIKLWNFSIVNGGQTTNRIGKLDIEKDFFLHCKIVKAKGVNQEKKDKFALSIAEATNAQKPIKKADLKANTSEQLRLKERLSMCHVYYMTKKGDKAPKQYSEPYQVATLEQIGKLGLAAVLQMPGSSRSNSQKMYNDDYYYNIFGLEAKQGVYADLLRIAIYYDKFLKNHVKGKGYDEKTVLPMLKNGRTFQYACITLLCKINYGVFTYDSIVKMLSNVDELKVVLRQMGEMDKLISVHLDNEDELFYEIFSIIGEDVLGYCYENALDKAEEEQKTVAPSDYLKLDSNYYKDVIRRLWSRYNKSTKLRKNIELICGKVK